MPEAAVPSPAVFLDTLPPWASDLVRAVNAKQSNAFVLHGVPADLIPVRGPAGLRFLSLDDFLVQQLFSGWGSIITYNRAEGLGFATPAARVHFQDRLRAYDTVHGTNWADSLPRDAPNCFALLDSYFRLCASAQPCRPVVLILPFAETIVPAAEVAYRTPEDRAVLVYLRKWSQDPVLLAKNIVVVMVTESLAELDPKLVRAHSTREIEIVRPDQKERLTNLEAVRPVGSAKTFLVECFAREIGFPCVKLKNFRSMWVGATESNLERILKILSALTPVGVVVDEADAALGNRDQQGDSGTQNRVFAQIAAFMGDTQYRGRILWFLITARPDLLPIDLKRQGRAEEHIPLFYPETAPEYDEIYRVMLKKLGLKTAVTSISSVATEDQYLGLSGSDLEAVLVRATLEAEAADSAEVKAEHLQKAFSDFIPPANSREREMQILCAVLECTSRELLPERFRTLDRGEVQARINEIKRDLRLM